MTKEEIIKKLRDMAKYPTVTLPRDTEALRNAADLLEQAQQAEPFGYFQFDLRLDAWVQNRHSDKGVAFYTSPPVASNDTSQHRVDETAKQEHEPLTDEQLKPLIQKAMRYYGHNPDHWHLTAGAGYCLLARAIEAAHGIKGEG